MEFQPMSPEEVQRTMQFLLHQQARFEANIATLTEKTTTVSQGLVGLTVLANQTERKVHELADSVGTVRDGINALTGIVGRMSERIERLGERVDERLDRLAQAQEETDRQIKEVGAHFQRHLAEDHRRRPS